MATWRKIQKTGGGSYAVTLPKAWAELHGIKQRSVVSIISNEDGSLTIVPEDARLRPPSTEITIRDGPTLTREIIGAYLLGFDTIRVQSSTSFQTGLANAARQTVRRLAGAEIVEELPNRIVIKVLLDPAAVAPEIVLRREGALVDGMIVDSVNALARSDLSLAKAVAGRDEEVDRQYFILVRTIRSAIRDPEICRRMKLTPLHLLDLRLVARFLEDSGDEAAALAREIVKSGKAGMDNQTAETLTRLGQLVSELTREAMDAFLAEDHNMAVRVISKHESFAPRSLEAEEMVIGRDSSLQSLVSRALARLEMMAANAYDIAELAFPTALEP